MAAAAAGKVVVGNESVFRQRKFLADLLDLGIRKLQCPTNECISEKGSFPSDWEQKPERQQPKWQQ